ncbi:MAG: ComF family protein [Leptolyngbya sp. Prado105]|jgi:ComF family protein|nr:ComF family protein [Leptolyngbya sp. Prado105]
MFNEVLSLILQRSCPLCDRATAKYLCVDCQRRLERDQLTNPTEFWQQRIFAWGDYTDTLKRTLAALKYDRHPELGILLGEALARSWIAAKLQSGKLTVIPIPMHLEKQKQRGYNQAELISRAFCQMTGDSHHPSGLRRVRATEALFGLSPQDREQTLTQAFDLGKGIKQNRPVLLIDDIHTTGATARAAIQVLHRHQIRVLGIAVVAKPRFEKR